MKGRLLLADGHSLAFRAFYALPNLTTRSGTPTGAVYGFTTMMLKALEEVKPTHAACAFDSPGPTHRHLVYSAYKEGREKAPEGFREQVELIKEMCEALGVRPVQQQGMEADDLLFCLAEEAVEEGLEVFLVTVDKDLFPLLSLPGVRIIRPLKGISEFALYDEGLFEREFGFKPHLFPDYLALSGDKVDNIPGVKGIGEKTAKELVARFGGLEDLYQRLEEVPKATREKLIRGREEAFRGRELIRPIRPGCPAIPKTEELRFTGLKEGPFRDLCLRLEFNSLLKRVSPRGDEAEVVRAKVGSVAVKTIELLEGALKSRRLALGVALEGKYPEGARAREVRLSLPDGRICALDEKALADPETAKALKALLEDEGVEKLLLEAKEGWTALSKLGIRPRGIVFDLASALYLISPDRSESSRRAEVMGLFEDLPALFGRAEDLLSRIRTEGMEDLMREIDLPLAEVLSAMELRGVGVDLEGLGLLRDKLLDELEALERSICEESSCRINLRSPKQMAWLLFEKLGMKGESRKLSTDQSALKRLLRAYPQHEGLLSSIMRHRELSRVLSGFVEPFLEMTDPGARRIHSTFSAIATGTGRIASRNPNLQNLPTYGEMASSFKRCLLPSKGHLLLACDYKQVEVRVMAAMSGDPDLIAIASSGEDIHAQTACAIFGLRPEEVTQAHRRAAKEVNFGILYGMTPHGLAERLEISRHEAQELIDRYFARFRVLKGFLHHLKEEALSRGYTRTLFGRRRYLRDSGARGDEIERMAVNSPVQGTAADMTKLAMIGFHRRRGKAHILLQVHDSVICEAPEGEEEAALTTLKEEMERAPLRALGDFPFPCDARLGRDMSEVW